MNRILIIEDDTDINNMMAEALQKSGMSARRHFPERKDFFILNAMLFLLPFWI